jgi:hypothetical protein
MNKDKTDRVHNTSIMKIILLNYMRSRSIDQTSECWAGGDILGAIN